MRPTLVAATTACSSTLRRMSARPRSSRESSWASVTVSTGANGTGFVNNATLNDGLYYGQGGLGAGCVWEGHAAASLPGIVFIQVFRKTDATPATCND